MIEGVTWWGVLVRRSYIFFSGSNLAALLPFQRSLLLLSMRLYTQFVTESHVVISYFVKCNIEIDQFCLFVDNLDS